MGSDFLHATYSPSLILHRMPPLDILLSYNHSLPITPFSFTFSFMPGSPSPPPPPPTSLPFHFGCRLHHYDCLVMPVTSLAPCFPWEKVALLVEYEQAKATPMFDGTLPRNLEKYIVLRTVQDVCSGGKRE